jgi:hypothetical protein
LDIPEHDSLVRIRKLEVAAAAAVVGIGTETLLAVVVVDNPVVDQEFHSAD